MAEEKLMRLSQVARKLNVGITSIVEHLSAKGFEVESNPNSKITDEMLTILSKEFDNFAQEKNKASGLTIGKKHMGDVVIDTTKVDTKKDAEEEEEIIIKNVAPSVAEPVVSKPAEIPDPEPVIVPETPVQEETPEATGKVKLQGLNVLGKIELPADKSKSSKKSTETKPTEKVETKEKPIKDTTPNEETPKALVEEVITPVAPIQEEILVAPSTPVIEDVVPESVIKAEADKLQGLKVLGKIELPTEKKKEPTRVASSDDKDKKNKRKRKRMTSGGGTPVPVQPNTGGATGGQHSGNRGPRPDNRNNNNKKDFKKPQEKQELSDKEIQDKIKATMAKLSGTGKSSPVSRAKYRKDKRSSAAEAEEERLLQEQEDARILKVTEFISASDLASLMEVSVNDVISKCLMMGMFVSINQRLDAEAITIIADEFGYDVSFQTVTEDEDAQEEEADEPDSLVERAPIVTIMGHVDHGKTSLLDYIRRTKIAAGEAGGITQHVGAYNVVTDSGKPITFLDTPGHEAFTAMRARGAKITDIVIIVVAADDGVMPQTREAINHARVAGVPIIIAINKIDKPGANTDRIKEELSKENILVEDWGGKYQCQPISAKQGTGITELLEKVLLEAELLELKANPDKQAVGAVIEASLDKGRGFTANILVQAGTLSIGDIVLAGAHFGKVKAMLDHLGNRLKTAGPSMPVQLLGLNGAPQAGDKFQVMETEREAREIATKREQLIREQSLRTKKHITLDEIGRRLAIGNFKELNVIVKGDVDGSVEALSDSLLKLSTDEIQVRIIHKGVGQISESDILLASASDAIIVAFQVRPSSSAKKLAEQEQIEIRMYSIIYDAINDVKDAMEGMLEPKKVEVELGSMEVRSVFKISKVGTIAGCYVQEGTIKRNSLIRVVRQGIVIHTGQLDSLKRFKDDVSEVKSGYECGLSVRNFNDIQEYDIIESFEEKEVKRTL
ncbi:MAG: translation initiation factor IF-2 [Cytophagaceae bacterium]|jgi:translation initiation factor IF-2|nr:translation initiation factor IF-2 [Cytophagaceae bacterium]